MKIVLPVYIGGHGGASRQVTKLANFLANQDNEVYMVALHHFRPVFPIDKRIEIIDITDKVIGGFIPILSRWQALRKVLKELRPDVSIHYNFQSVYLTVFSFASNRGKIIMAERGDPSDSEYDGLLGVIRKIAIKYVDGFVFQTKGAMSYFNQRIQSRSIVIPNSVSMDEDILSIKTPRESFVLSAGRLHPQKNHPLLIKAFARIAYRHPHYKLWIYGDGELREELQSLVRDLGMEGRIFIEYSVKDIFMKMKKCTAFVLSSDFEGMPNALMEAMALGAPCISTDCNPGGARDLIINGVNGWIVPRGDEMALADKIDYVLSHLDKAKIVGEKAMEILKTNSDHVIFSKWEEFIKKIIG